MQLIWHFVNFHPFSHANPGHKYLRVQNSKRLSFTGVMRNFDPIQWTIIKSEKPDQSVRKWNTVWERSVGWANLSVFIKKQDAKLVTMDFGLRACQITTRGRLRTFSKSLRLISSLRGSLAHPQAPFALGGQPCTVYNALDNCSRGEQNNVCSSKKLCSCRLSGSTENRASERCKSTLSSC